MASPTTTARTASPGGAFLIEAPRPDEVFTPEELTDDQRLIGRAAEEFVAKEVMPLVADLEQHKQGLMPQLVKKAGELGLLGGGIPEEYGGAGLDKVSGTLLSEKVSTYASFSVTVGAHSGIGALPIVYFGTEEQKRKYLPKIATGEWISCYCLSEPQAGSDAQNSRTRAVLSSGGKHWILNGQKMWISNGGFADVFIVFAKVDGEKFSCFIVERGFPGLSVGADEKDGSPRQLHRASLPRKLPGAPRKSPPRGWSRPHRGFQRVECRPSDVGGFLRRRRQDHA